MIIGRVTLAQPGGAKSICMPQFQRRNSLEALLLSRVMLNRGRDLPLNPLKSASLPAVVWFLARNADTCLLRRANIAPTAVRKCNPLQEINQRFGLILEPTLSRLLHLPMRQKEKNAVNAVSLSLREPVSVLFAEPLNVWELSILGRRHKGKISFVPSDR